MDFNSRLPLFVSIPHSGEQVPEEVFWLKSLAEPHLMRDVDRFVDKLYEPAIKELHLPFVLTQWHRYVVDLNRSTDQVDQDSVQGANHPSGAHPKGLHWSVTTFGEKLIPEPMAEELHQKIIKNYYLPFHDSVQALATRALSQSKNIFHMDLHSMPSKGTTFHPDPGEERAEVVISDFHGKSSIPFFKDLVMEAYQKAGFQVAYNWPYVGGGITQRYGDPQKGHNTIQVELNRALYMDESTKQPQEKLWPGIQAQLKKALLLIVEGVQEYQDEQK